MFELIKKWFFTGIAFLSVLASINPLKCISMSNQDCKLRPEFVILIVMNLHFILTVLK